MTVKELIRLLKRVPPHALVLRDSDSIYDLVELETDDMKLTTVKKHVSHCETPRMYSEDSGGFTALIIC